MNTHILIVEDDERLRRMLIEATTADGYKVEGVATAEEAVERLAKENFQIVLTDITLPGMSGLDLLPQCARLCPGATMIVMTAYGTIETAVEAMKRGAADFITKPFQLDHLSGVLRVASERAATKRASQEKKSATVIAESHLMRRLLEQVTAIAPFNTTVLITGETGVGKEIIARSVHNQSPRRAKPVVALNCAAVPENLLEDELFGHVKGAFTGAQTAREGRFEQAEGGTLFLDEIGDMSLPLQAKLLRVLQEREFERLGSSRTVKVDVRIVAATSADLEKRIAEGTFRADLFYRLNVVHLRVPPLRERPEDIRPLAKHFLARFCSMAGLPQKSVSEEAWSALVNYRFPGNVRQLQNAMERAAALSGAATVVQLHDLPEEVRGGAASGVSPALAAPAAPSVQSMPDEGVNFDAVVTQVERELLLQSLDKASGNKMRAAKLLNMKRTTFVEKLKRLQINADEKDERAADDE